jgi:membrane-bound metal-dependent hydrolase YbcI (DUF457 family)
VAGFKTHITVSTSCGVAYGAAGCLCLEMPPSVSVLGAALCSVSGMLPDLDSDSGVPLRESLAFAAAVVPLLMVPRFRQFEWSPETIVMAGCIVYALVRFGVGWLLKKYTVHRGMFHSLPAALIATEVAFLVYSREDINLRYFVAGGVAIGFLSHLILDEIWSVGVKRGQLMLKKSSGTAFKFWGDSRWANVSCYGKLLALSFLVLHDPVWTYNSTPPTENIRLIAQKFIDRLRGRATDEIDAPPLREISKSQLSERNFGNDYGTGYIDQRRYGSVYEEPAPNPRFRDDQYQPPQYNYNRRPRYQR